MMVNLGYECSFLIFKHFNFVRPCRVDDKILGYFEIVLQIYKLCLE